MLAGTIPPALVGPIRAALVSQGFPGQSILDSGNLDPAALFSGVYDRLQFRSHLTPPIGIDLATAGGPPSLFTRLVRPTIILSGQAGRTVIAPEGEASPVVGALVSLGLVGVIFALGFLAGRAGGR